MAIGGWLESQVIELPKQVSKTHERLEGLSLRLRNEDYIVAERAKPGEN